MSKVLTSRCTDCLLVLPAEHFSWKNALMGKRMERCKKCRALRQRSWYAKNKDRQNATRRTKYAQDPKQRDLVRGQNLAKYGLTLEQYKQMEKKQGGVCAICGELHPWRGRLVLHVDHCHRTKKVRGLLCHRCNVALGQFGDEPARLQKAIEYLVRSR